VLDQKVDAALLGEHFEKALFCGEIEPGLLGHAERHGRRLGQSREHIRLLLGEADAQDRIVQGNGAALLRLVGHVGIICEFFDRALQVADLRAVVFEQSISPGTLDDDVEAAIRVAAYDGYDIDSATDGMQMILLEEVDAELRAILNGAGHHGPIPLLENMQRKP
jgi:hypothetical protein